METKKINYALLAAELLAYVHQTDFSSLRCEISANGITVIPRDGNTIYGVTDIIDFARGRRLSIYASVFYRDADRTIPVAGFQLYSIF